MTHLKFILLILFPIIVAAASIKSFGRYSPGVVKRYIDSTYNNVEEYNKAVKATNIAVNLYDEAEKKLKQAQKSVNDALASEDRKRSDIEESVDTVIALLKSTYLYPKELAAFERIAKQVWITAFYGLLQIVKVEKRKSVIDQWSIGYFKHFEQHRRFKFFVCVWAYSKILI